MLFGEQMPPFFKINQKKMNCTCTLPLAGWVSRTWEGLKMSKLDFWRKANVQNLLFSKWIYNER